jgi:4-amino-4-deoxy-L-arabinose transferase-like glycosyltransferase
MKQASFQVAFPLAGLVLTAGLALRFWQIGHAGLWLDEAFSLWMASQKLTDMAGWLVRIDQHPPLYYGLLHGWLAGGSGEGWVRAFSALCSVATIPIFYAAVRLLQGTQTAQVAALILAVAPFHVRYAQEARMYALLTLLVAAVLLCLALLVQPRAALPRPPVVRRAAWAGYVLFSTATLLTHNTAVLFLLALNFCVVGWWVWAQCQRQPPPPGESSLDRPALSSWCAAQGTIFVLWLPWAAPFVQQSQGVLQQFWIPAPTAESVLQALQNLTTGGVDSGWATALFWFFCVPLTAVGGWTLRRQRTRLLLWLALWLIPFAGELAVSLVRPIFSDRTLIGASLPIYVLWATGIARWRRPVRAGLLLLLLAGEGAVLVSQFQTSRKEEWREAAAYVARQLQPGDLLLFNATWVQIPFDYYFERSALTAERRGVPADLFDAGLLEPIMTEQDLPRLTELIAGRSRVWLIYSHNWYTDPHKLIPTHLQKNLDWVERRSFYGLELRLYCRWSADCRPGEGQAPPNPCSIPDRACFDTLLQL